MRNVVENILGKKSMVFWVEDIDDPSVEFGESVSYSKTQTNTIKKMLQNQLPGRRLITKQGYDSRW